MKINYGKILFIALVVVSFCSMAKAGNQTLPAASDAGTWDNIFNVQPGYGYVNTTNAPFTVECHVVSGENNIALMRGNGSTLLQAIDCYNFGSVTLQPGERVRAVAWHNVSGVWWFTDPPSPSNYNLTVNNGQVSGTYPEGSTVYIAPIVPQGQLFVSWTGDVDHLTTAANVANGSILMPNHDVTVTATFTTQNPHLTVVGGITSGDYAQGTLVAISPTVPQGQHFVKWVSAELLGLPDTTANNSLLMPGTDYTITATFADGDNPGGSGDDPYHVWVDNFNELTNIITVPIVNKLSEIKVDTGHIATDTANILEVQVQTYSLLVNLKNEVGQKLASIDSHVTSIDGKLDHTNSTLDAIFDTLEAINEKLVPGGSVIIDNPEIPGKNVPKHSFPTIEDDTHLDENPNDLRPSFIDDFKDKIEDIRNSQPGQGVDWVLPLHKLYSGLEDISFNFSGSGAYPFFVELRDMCREFFVVIIWVLTAFQWFSIVKSITDIL